jgi:PmbA protein
MEQLLARALQQVDHAEVFERKVRQQSVTFHGNKLKEISQSEEQDTTLRLIRDGRLGSAQSSKPGSESELLAYALETVNYGGSVAYGWPGANETHSPVVYDKRVEDISQRDMLELAADMISAINSYDASILAMAGVSKQLYEATLMNSAGFRGRETSSLWTMFLGGEFTNEEGFLFVYDHLSGCNFTADTEALKGKVIEAFRLARNIVPIRAGQYPVIFAPAQVGTLVNPLLACLNGKAIARGVSPFKGRLGDTLFDPRITIADDPHVDGASGSQGFDREAVPTAAYNLIESGRVTNFMLDLQSASELGLKPTGNGSLDGPVPNNIILRPGDQSLQEMLAGTDEGILIEMTMGAWAGNPYGGQVSGNVSLGYKIEKGQLVGRVKDTMFSLNVLQDLRDNLHGLSREQVWQGNYCFPYVQLNNVNISAK